MVLVLLIVMHRMEPRVNNANIQRGGSGKQNIGKAEKSQKAESGNSFQGKVIKIIVSHPITEVIF